MATRAKPQLGIAGSNGHVPDEHDGVDYALDAPDVAVTGPASDDVFEFETSHGTIRIKSMAKGKNPPPFAMMKAEAEKNFSRMTLMVIKVKAGDDYPEIESILEQLDEDEFKAFSEGWAAFSGVTVGE